MFIIELLCIGIKLNIRLLVILLAIILSLLTIAPLYSSQYYTIDIVSNVEGYAVYIDDNFMGYSFSTTYSIEVPEGVHILSVIKQGYQWYNTTISIHTDTLVNVNLLRNTGSDTIQVSPNNVLCSYNS